jgi:hypothetical protein
MASLRTIREFANAILLSDVIGYLADVLAGGVIRCRYFQLNRVAFAGAEEVDGC